MEQISEERFIIAAEEAGLTADDVVAFIKAQHDTIRLLFEAVLELQGDERERVFHQLRRLLAVHETAEEQIIHPAVRKTLERGDAIAAERLAEEHEAKEALSALEGLDPASTRFENALRALQLDVVRHADAEENLELDGLSLELDGEQLVRMRKIFVLAEAVAPTRPHAGIESALANTLVGPFASIVDRVRDLVVGKR
jgi:hemerythrin superfamily protein